MALIIKGDMPKACNWFDKNGKHRFCNVNAFCDCRIYSRGKRPSDCPILGEIPDEHGDLIDRNQLPIIGITDYKLEGHTVVEFEDILNAPTVVEANR